VTSNNYTVQHHPYWLALYVHSRPTMPIARLMNVQSLSNSTWITVTVSDQSYNVCLMTKYTVSQKKTRQPWQAVVSRSFESVEPAAD